MSGLLLVEARRAAGLGETSAEPFPYFAGYARARGVAARWVCFPPAARAPAPDPLLLDLGRSAREVLAAKARALPAARVLLSEVPSSALRAWAARALPGTRLLHCAGREDYYDARWLSARLGLPSEPGRLLDLCSPRYAAEAAGELGAPPPTPLVGAPACLYAAPLSGNPAFAGVDLSGIARRFACSFCPGPADLRPRQRTPPLEAALAQVRAVSREPRALWSRTEFLVRSAPVFFAMTRFFRRLERLGTPPSRFYFSCRADEALARRADIEEALGLARRLGHSVHVFSMGAENFSPAENERFNKGLGLAEVREALALMRGWEERFPETFAFTRHGGLGFILWTPWTTLEDLRLNAAAARELGLTEDAFLLTRRLMLFADMPLTRLAERDGLVDPASPADRALFERLRRRCDPGCRHLLEESDRPWRFRDPLTARVCAVAVSLADPRVDADPRQKRVRRAFEASGLRALEAFALLLELARRRPDAPLPALADGFASLLERLPRRR